MRAHRWRREERGFRWEHFDGRDGSGSARASASAHRSAATLEGDPSKPTMVCLRVSMLALQYSGNWCLARAQRTELGGLRQPSAPEQLALVSSAR